MRIRPATGVLISGLVLTLAASLGLGSTAGAAAEDRRTQQPSAAAARQALADARDALSGTAGKPSRDATMALRDLYKALPGLNAADRRTAESILARPTDPGDDRFYGSGADVKTACGVQVCVHWVESGPHAATPEYAAEVVSTVNAVGQTFLDAGYRAPKPDGGQGGSDQSDVYLAEISDYAYGYCASDEPVVDGQYDYWAYCVLENDYAEFPNNTPTENLRVTAAHEYFHAVQGAYDWYEDRWFMESTASWAEDEFFDDVNDNLDHLPSGQLGNPRVPLDSSAAANVYGNWVFVRFLTETIPDEAGGLPILVRAMWENADSTRGTGNDQYSLQAISSALAGAGLPFPAAYAAFATANRQPATGYEEGAENAYPTPPLSFQPITLTPSKPRTTWGTVKQAHLTNDTVRFVPGATMKAKSWKLKVQVNMAPRSRGSAATVTVFFKDGRAGIKQVRLDGQGDGATTVDFSRSGVAKVELTMINASERTECWAATGGIPYSCFGIPKDDNLKQQFRGAASR